MWSGFPTSNYCEDSAPRPALAAGWPTPVWILVDLQAWVCNYVRMTTVRRWARRHRRALTYGAAAGIPIGMVSGFLTSQVSFQYALIGSVTTALILGWVYSYLFRPESRE